MTQDKGRACPIFCQHLPGATRLPPESPNELISCTDDDEFAGLIT